MGTRSFASGERAGSGKEEITRLTRRIALVVISGLVLGATAQGAAPSDRTPVVVKVTDGGFNWGDAAIGAAGGGALTLLAVGAVYGTRRQPNESERIES